VSDRPPREKEYAPPGGVRAQVRALEAQLDTARQWAAAEQMRADVAERKLAKVLAALRELVP